MELSKFMLSEILGCGEYDIDYLFKGMDYDILSSAIKNCENEFGKLSCDGIWQMAVEIGLSLAFDDEFDYNDFDIHFNYIDSDIHFVGDIADYTDFEDKCDNFASLTGFDIQYDE
jgi:hypothetical protein